MACVKMSAWPEYFPTLQLKANLVAAIMSKIGSSVVKVATACDLLDSHRVMVSEQMVYSRNSTLPTQPFMIDING